MKIPFYLINAFTNLKHHSNGNPCAVIHLPKGIPSEEMQELAKFLQQPATAFINPVKELEYNVRWFAPDAEISICGHGAYASFASIHHLNKKSQIYTLHTISGQQITGEVSNDGDINMLMPIIAHEIESKPPIGLSEALGCEIISYHRTNNKHIVKLKDQQELANMKPDFDLLRKLDVFGYSVTAKASDSSIDFVSRTIVPHVAQLEDHATGSSHAALFPYWTNILEKNELTALQLSTRGGFFKGKTIEDGVFIRSNTEIKIEGQINL